jgi:hypothetical protein
MLRCALEGESVMITKLLSPVLSVIIIFLILALDHIWRDKRAKSYKRIRMIVLAVMVTSLVVNMAIVVDSERTSGQLRATINDLKQEVASLENQKKELSLLERMHRFITTDYDALARKYPKGYFLFANNKFTVIPSNREIKSSFTLDWNSSKVSFMDENFVYITLKGFHYHPNEIKVENLNIVVRRKVGATADGIMFDGVGLFVEVLDERAEDLIYLIGFKRVESTAKLWNLDPDVQTFITKIGSPGVVARIDTNTKKYITIRDGTVCSGWEPAKR